MKLIEYLDFCIILRDNDYMLRRVGWVDKIHYQVPTGEKNG